MPGLAKGFFQKNAWLSKRLFQKNTLFFDNRTK
jgi:hypothetical protein